MKTFHCDVCGNLVFFENTHCVNCHHALGFIPALLELSALVPETEGGERVVAPAASGHLFRHCGNRDTPAACNWLVPAAETGTFCAACRLDEIIPDLSIAENSEHWHQLEAAKRRLIYTLLKLHLPFAGTAHGKPPLRFRFLGDPPGGPAILTGHEHGTITVNVAEADDLIREQRRASLHEPFRTLLGHFRHEAAHYYWEVLVEGTAWLEPFRTLFGDERADYGEALRRHHAHGPDAGWEKHWVSAYASSHPWEDWAETCAHYLHIIDTIET
ncbi:MAG TPA: putative zinc-binding metallopeptidase, partial [Lacunisphaera sp.]|nr:putative zinc-binding metallopeptidase [Lacunisphaera sp.]